MGSSRRSVAAGGVAVLLVLAGCVSGGVGGTASPGRTPTPPGSPTPTPGATTTSSPTPGATASTPACAEWVSFYGLESPGESLWAPDRVAIGYTVPANASVLFVVVENGTVLGSTHVTTTDIEYGVTADGDGVPLDRPLEGTHTLRIVAYADANRNGQFDPGTDTRCRDGGGRVEAGPRRIDFDDIQYTPTPAPTAS